MKKITLSKLKQIFFSDNVSLFRPRQRLVEEELFGSFRFRKIDPTHVDDGFQNIRLTAGLRYIRNTDHTDIDRKKRRTPIPVSLKR